MHIVYATRAAIPYRSAASWNSVQMCQALTRLGHDVTLAIGRKFWRWPAAWHGGWRLYGMTPAFHIRRFWELPRSGSWFDRQVARFAQEQQALIYLRYPRLLDRTIPAEQPALLELHSRLSADDLRRVARGLAAGSLMGLVVITEALRNVLTADRQLAPFAERIFVAPDAVDCQRFTTPSSEDAAAVIPQRVGYFGSLYPGKGVEVLTEVARYLPKTEFAIFGGPTKLVKQWSRSARTLPNLCFRGYLPPADVPVEMSRCPIGLLPNQPSVRLPNGDDIGAFTSPMKLFEYMASGRAIVASDLPGLREILVHEQNGLLVAHDDPAAWAAAIRRLQEDAALRQRLGRQAAREAQDCYSFETRFRRIFRRFLPQAS